MTAFGTGGSRSQLGLGQDEPQRGQSAALQAFGASTNSGPEGAEPATADAEEEEDDENAGGDDEETINKKYQGRYNKLGMEAKAEEIRQKLKQRGIEEPVDMSRPVSSERKVKARTLEVVFLDPDEALGEKHITFRRKAHGITWDKRPPLEVQKVKNGSHGAEFGVEEGWIVRDVNGIDYTGKKKGRCHREVQQGCELPA